MASSAAAVGRAGQAGASLRCEVLGPSEGAGHGRPSIGRWGTDWIRILKLRNCTMYHIREAIWPLMKSKDMESIGLRNCWIGKIEPRIFGVQSLCDNEHEDGDVLAGMKRDPQVAYLVKGSL